MYSSVQIRNFRGFEKLKLDKLERVTLLAGRNNTGKSAILEALFLLCSGPLAGQSALGAIRVFRGEGNEAPEVTGDSTPWDTLYHNFDFEQSITIDGRRIGRNSIGVKLDRDESMSSQISVGAGSVPISRKIHVNFAEGDLSRDYVQTVTYQVSNINTGISVPGIQQQSITVQSNVEPAASSAEKAFFIGARLRANQQELANRYSALRRRGAERELIAALQLVEPRLERLEVLVEQGQPALHFQMSGSQPSFPMSVLGEGIASVVDFVTSIQQARGGVVLIDEVENGLHHSILEGIWIQLYRAAERADVQIIATTHSQECVEAARSAMAKRPRELSLIRLRRPKGGLAVEPVSYDAESLTGAIEGGLDVR